MRRLVICITTVVALAATVATVSLAAKKKPRKRQPALAAPAVPHNLFEIQGEGANMRFVPAQPAAPHNGYLMQRQNADKLIDVDDLVDDVAQVMGQRQPKNPGRQRTFDRLLASDSGFEFRGWTLVITKVEKTAAGWQAEMVVHAQTLMGGTYAITAFKHWETWSWNGEQLKLISERSDTPKDNEPWVILM